MVNLALIGLGQMGKNYLNTVSSLKGVRIKYICTRTQARLDNFPNTYTKITNFKNLIEFGDLDGVIIATPGSTHFEIAKYFIEKKIPTLIEKPLTTNFPQALKLLKLQKKTESKVLVGHTILFYQAVLKVKNLLKKTSKILSLEFDGRNNHPRLDASIFWDWGPHGSSLCLFLFDQNPISIKAFANKSNPKLNYHDQATLQMDYESGSNVLLKMHWDSPQKVRKFAIQTVDKLIKFDDFENPKLKIVNNKKEIIPISIKPIPPLNLELKGFIDLIKKDKPTLSDLEFGVRVTKILNLAEKSLKSGGKAIKFT